MDQLNDLQTFNVNLPQFRGNSNENFVCTKISLVNKTTVKKISKATNY